MQIIYPRGGGIKEGREGQVEVSQREEGRILQMCKRHKSCAKWKSHEKMS